MAILSFALTTEEFVSGKKTVTRRDWAPRHFKMWQNFWNAGRLEHEAWDKIPIAGGKPIGKFRLTAQPYLEQLAHMPEQDLIAEGGMCDTLEEYYQLIGKSPEDTVAVIRFEKI